MTKFLFCCMLLYVPFWLKAQQNRFIYIQTENKQPFYIKLDKKVFSSSASGYVIIPQLKDGDYSLTAGFPKNEWPEQLINCRVDKKDAGYVLKNFGEKGWGLFNLQSLEVLMAGAKPVSSSAVLTQNKKDEFSDILSNAVNDSSIRMVEIPKPVVKKEEPVKTAPPAVIEAPPVKSEVPDQPAVAAVQSEAAKTAVSRLLYLNGKEGLQMVYSVVANGRADTVRLLIPADKAAPPAAVNNETKPEVPFKKEAAAEPVVQNREKFIDIELPNPNSKKEEKPAVAKEPVVEKTREAVVTEPKKVAMINSNCQNYAGEEDFLKLRKKMAAAENDDDMIAAAKKVFKTRCFTVEQVKNLGVLFLKDEGRYKFYDAAYPFVSDSEKFSTLGSQLTDEYYINRFNAIIRH